MQSLADMRELAGYTQAEAGRRLGFARETLVRFEAGDPQVIARRHYRRMARLYRVTVRDIAAAAGRAQRQHRRGGKKR